MKNQILIFSFIFLLANQLYAEVSSPSPEAMKVEVQDGSEGAKIQKPSFYSLLDATNRMKIMAGYLLNERTGGTASSVGMRISDNLYFSLGHRDVRYHHMDNYVSGSRLTRRADLRGVDVTISTDLRLWSLPTIELAGGIEYAKANVEIETGSAGVIHRESFQGVGAVFRPSVFYPVNLFGGQLRAGLGLDLRTFTKSFSYNNNGDHYEEDLPKGFNSAAYVFIEGLLF